MLNHLHRCTCHCLLSLTCCIDLHSALLLPSSRCLSHAAGQIAIGLRTLHRVSWCRRRIHLLCCWPTYRRRCLRRNGRTCHFRSPYCTTTLLNSELHPSMSWSHCRVSDHLSTVHCILLLFCKCTISVELVNSSRKVLPASHWILVL